LLRLRPLARDADARGVEGVVPQRAEALDHAPEARHQAAPGELVEALEHLVDALAGEGFDRLGLDRELQHVAVVELARAVLEAREPRVAEDRILRHRHRVPPRGTKATRAGPRLARCSPFLDDRPWV